MPEWCLEEEEGSDNEAENGGHDDDTFSDGNRPDGSRKRPRREFKTGVSLVICINLDGLFHLYLAQILKLHKSSWYSSRVFCAELSSFQTSYEFPRTEEVSEATGSQLLETRFLSERYQISRSLKITTM